MIMRSAVAQQEPKITSINISPGGIPKRPMDSVVVTQFGLAGDGHNHEKHNNPIQAVCLQDVELLEGLCREGFSLSCGTIGENLTVSHLDVQHLSVGTILEFSGGVVLELTKERKPCYVLDSIDPRLKEVIVGRCGFYAKVVREGILKTGEKIDISQPTRFTSGNLDPTA